MDTIVPNGNLDGKMVAVVGATGSVGEGITRSLLQAGARVLAFGRTDAKLAELRRLLVGGNDKNLITVAGDTHTFDGFRALADKAAAEYGPFAHVATSIGGWWQGKTVWQVDDQDFDATLGGPLKGHIAAARALAPNMMQGGSYSFIAGLSAIYPIPRTSLRNMVGAAQLMLAQALQVEVGDQLRINTLALGFVVSRSRPRSDPNWISAEDVGNMIVTLANSDVAGQLIRSDDRPTAIHSLKALGL